MYELTTVWPFIIVAYPVFVLLIMLSIKKINFRGIKSEDEIFTIQETNLLRGIAALLVLFHHYSQVLQNPGLMYYYWYVGFMAVGFFMFASGYASFVQYDKKGKGMFHFYVIKRVLRLLIPFIIIDLIFAICNRVAIKKYFYSVITIQIAKNNDTSSWTSVWFLWAMLFLTILFFICFRFSKDTKKSILFIFAGIATYILILYLVGFGFWWYNSVLAYGYGILFAKYKKNIIAFIQRFYILLMSFSTVMTIGLLFYMSKGHYTFWPQSICVITSLTLIICLFSKIEFRKTVLNYIGIASLEVFLIQGLRSVYFVEDVCRPGYQIVICIVLMVLLAIGVNVVDEKIYRMLIRKLK